MKNNLSKRLYELADAWKEDPEDLDFIEDEVKQIGSYVERVFAMETQIPLCMARYEGQDLRGRITTLDSNRKIAHEAAIGAVNILGRMAVQKNIEPLFTREDKTDTRPFDLHDLNDRNTVHEFCKELVDQAFDDKSGREFDIDKFMEEWEKSQSQEKEPPIEDKVAAAVPDLAVAIKDEYYYAMTKGKAIEEIMPRSGINFAKEEIAKLLREEVAKTASEIIKDDPAKEDFVKEALMKGLRELTYEEFLSQEDPGEHWVESVIEMEEAVKNGLQTEYESFKADMQKHPENPREVYSRHPAIGNSCQEAVKVFYNNINNIDGKKIAEDIMNQYGKMQDGEMVVDDKALVEERFGKTLSEVNQDHGHEEELDHNNRTEIETPSRTDDEGLH